MTKEIRAVIDTIQTADSMKAVKVAVGLSETLIKKVLAKLWKLLAC